MSSLTPEPQGTRFLVAKYIPDMRRLEPRNVGVIVWSNGNTSAQFLGEPSRDAEGTAHLPRRLGIQSQRTYRDWVQYWREKMSAAKLSLDGNGHWVSRESPSFVDALRRCSRENFVLVDGGFISGEIAPGEVDEVVHDLFAALVEETRETEDAAEKDAIPFKKAVARVFHASGIDRAEGYQAKIPLTFPVDSHTFAFTFDWGVYTSAPRLLCQHALLTRPMTVNSAAFMFSCLARSDHRPYRLSKDRCLALVRTTPRLLDNEASRRELEKLQAYGTVVDLADEERSIHELCGVSLSR